jgi:hypothetical protein
LYSAFDVLGSVAIGYGALSEIEDSKYNIAIGFNAGNEYLSSEESNILLGNSGEFGDDNKMRLGTTGSGNGEVNETYIAAIYGVTPSSTLAPVIIDSLGQLGTGASTSIFSWIDKAISFAASAGYGYFVTAAATATLPAAPNQGDTIAFAIDTGVGTLTIQANALQFINIGNTTSAAAGTATSIFTGDSVTLVYRSVSKTWKSISSIGNWTIV